MPAGAGHRYSPGPPRLVPVLVEGALLQPAYWTLSQKRSMLAAAADLAVREGVGTQEIGQWSREESVRRPPAA